jgi:hypothetical protein
MASEMAIPHLLSELVSPILRNALEEVGELRKRRILETTRQNGQTRLTILDRSAGFSLRA